MLKINPKIKKILTIILGVLIGLLFALPYLLFKEQIQNMSSIGYLGLFVACFISNLSILLPTSSTIIIMAAGFTLNPWICILIGGLGAAFGEQASYLCGLVGSSGFKNEEKIEKKALKWFDKKPFLTVFLFAFVPLPVFDVIGIIAGAKKMSWWKYTLAAVLGKILKFIVVYLVMFYLFPFLLKKLPGDIGNTLNGYFEQFLNKLRR